MTFPEIGSDNVLQCGTTLLDGKSVTLRCGAKVRNLTETEFNILRELFGHPNTLLSKQRLMDCNYGERSVIPREGIIRVYVHRIRNLLAGIDSNLTIETRHGLGWMLIVSGTNTLSI